MGGPPPLGYGWGKEPGEPRLRSQMTNSTTFAAGWGVSDDRGLDIHTVAETRRAAIVNWLVKARFLTRADHTDEDIEYLWMRHGVNPGRASVHKVKVYID